MDIDKISDKFENLPDWIIYFSYFPLIAEKAFAWLCQHNSFSFDQIFMKLADKMDLDEPSDELKNWPIQIIIR